MLTPEGRMVNSSGMSLLDTQGKPITITGQAVAIMGDGTIEVDGETTVTLGVADFDPNGYLGLENVGMGLFRKPAATNEAAKNTGTQVLQGNLEDSNADIIRQMVDMIAISRTFEMGQKSIQIQDQTLQRVVTELGVVR
jgi:flagellar basal-body rod protein FlgF